MIVKKSVDKPIMAATVPIREKRSFHKLTKVSPLMQRKTADYIIFPILGSVNHILDLLDSIEVSDF
jgi:hypothetical protein